MIEKIVHLADIHIRKTPTRNDEYQEVFNRLIESLKEKKPDRIVIAGDLVHDYLDLQGEQLIMACNLLNELAEIAPVRITRGNHDFRKSNPKRVDSIKAIVNAIKNPNVIYYNKTDIYYDENIAWAVWHHGEQKNNPWKTKEGKIYEKLRSTSVTKDENGNWTVPEYIAIDLFHDPISGCKSVTGFEMKSKSYYNNNDFKGDFSLCGDIHEKQFLDENKTKAFCGSLISQDVAEGDDHFHGYLLWNVIDKTVEEIPVYNDYTFKNIKITPYTDFDDLDYEISNPTKYMTIRFIWGTLPLTRNKENERKLTEYYNAKYGKISKIKYLNKNEFLESEKISVNKEITIENINNSIVQHEIFKEYLEKIGTDKNLIEDIIKLDEEISATISVDNILNIEWNIVKFGGKNFMSYAELDIDWRDMDGLFQITGINTAGKTTIMKLISYILFNKTLETETRMKYGDSRFINNRNGATSCEGYLVLEANGEYYGIKKKTELSKTKDGIINGAPTTLSYYMLNDPDQAMDVNTSLEKLDEDKRIKTQQKINGIIGSYDNFIRIVMTTSDTLNQILSNDMAVFIDSLLHDSGLDVFDKKLENLKLYQKNVNEKPRVSCNIEATNIQNIKLAEDISKLNKEIDLYETTTIPELHNRIISGRTYVESLSTKLFKIDTEIYNLNVSNIKNDIIVHNQHITEYKSLKSDLLKGISQLKEIYDENRYKELIEKKDAHKTIEYNKKLEIKNIQQEIRDEEHKIEIINGEIFRLKQEGGKLKSEIQELKESKICPTCNQPLLAEHQQHLDEKIEKLVNRMYEIAGNIKNKEKDIDLSHKSSIIIKQKDIAIINELIVTSALEMENILKEIGDLTNDKNDVEKRKELQNELNTIPTKIQNEELKITLLQQKIDNFDNNLLQIQENQKIEKGIEAAKSKLAILEFEEHELKEDVYIKKTSIGEKSLLIKYNNDLIKAFEEQEYRDNVMHLYKKCVHRDGIPRQILVNYILPKINITLQNILATTQFKIWLDIDDLRPKLIYNNRPNAIIDCISASGKERTFASVVLKFALNQINVKTKPTIFLLDEIMGKLDLEGSVDEFIEILHEIKNYVKKILIIEHVHELNPNYLIRVELVDEGISKLSIE